MVPAEETVRMGVRGASGGNSDGSFLGSRG